MRSVLAAAATLEGLSPIALDIVHITPGQIPPAAQAQAISGHPLAATNHNLAADTLLQPHGFTVAPIPPHG